MSSTERTFTVQLHLWDYFRAHCSIQLRSSRLKAAFVFLLALILLGLGLGLYAGEDASPLFHPWLWLGLLGFLVIVIPLIWMVVVHTMLKANPSAQTPQTYTFGMEGIGVAADEHQVELPWSRVLRIVETRKDFLFFVSKNAALFLPKRVLSRANELDELRQILHKGFAKCGPASLAREEADIPGRKT
ncbi:MAG: YcxB family protein [Gemmataceae bacterium]|nr:YcxB family protein [Gemmataceae bacterium]MCI0740574.1 YcxB family protein [Gemmataceae bacterium]